VARLWDRKEAYRVLMVRSEGKGLLVRTKRRWEDNIKMGLQELGEVQTLFILAQDTDSWRVPVNSVKNCRVP